MDTARKIEYYTIDDIYNLPDGQRAEYTFSDKIKVGIYEDLEIDFLKISIE